jgi:hypothetical protein
LRHLAATGTATFILSPMHWIEAAAEDIRSGHHFDIDSRTISPLSSTSFIPGALRQSPFNRLI